MLADLLCHTHLRTLVKICETDARTENGLRHVETSHHHTGVSRTRLKELIQGIFRSTNSNCPNLSNAMIHELVEKKGVSAVSLSGGNSNRVTKVAFDAEVVDCILGSGTGSLLTQHSSLLLREYGEGTCAFICREKEAEASAIFSKLGIAPQIVVSSIPWNSSTAWGRAEIFCEGYIAASTSLLLEENQILCQVLSHVREVHESVSQDDLSPLFDPKSPSLFQNFHNLLDNISFSIQEQICLEALRDEVSFVVMQISSTFSSNDIVFCHNDLNPSNILYSDSREMKLIDFEFSGLNFREFDIGNLLCELDYDYNEKSDAGFCKVHWKLAHEGNMYAPLIPMALFSDHSSEYIQSLGHYLRMSLDSYYGDCRKHFNKIFLCMLASHLMWGLWGISVACPSFGKAQKVDRQGFVIGASGLSYIEYAHCRLKEYCALKNWLMKNGFA